MPVMSGTVSCAADAVTANIFSGELFEFLSRNRRLSFRLAAAATGIYATILIGGVAIATEALISDANRFPIVPDDVLIVAGGRGGARLFATLRNSTAGAIVVEWVVDIV